MSVAGDAGSIPAFSLLFFFLEEPVQYGNLLTVLRFQDGRFGGHRT